MKVVNLDTVSVPTTAGGTEILSSAAAQAAMSEGLTDVLINPSVEIALVDPGGLVVSSSVPGAVVGTTANSAAVCPVGVTTVVKHRSGALRAIANTSTSTVKITLAEAP